ncbi:hypothetical protein C0993_010892 [Termitomyces sp. T159_Od127]|nr:hypothetical protein C0993_010892 [Termitomyces sp. T159_Od127]
MDLTIITPTPTPTPTSRHAHITANEANDNVFERHIHNTNTACCSIPPVQSDYTPQGSFKSYAGFSRVYVTGPEDSDTKIQGADIVASALKATVYMPHFFEPKGPYPIEKFPPQNEQDKHDLQEFFGGTASPAIAIQKLTDFGTALRNNGAKNVAAYGFCWGI